MGVDRRRVVEVWRRTIALGWPVSVQAGFQTLMRTTDVVITGLFSPAAVAALGLADLYAELSLRLGNGLGAGAIALSSQDTGSGAAANRDEAVTQAVLMAALTGLPLVAFGVLFGREAIAVLGASPTVASLGGTYLGIIFAASPFRHVALTGIKALQGTGDTRTPMAITILANVINIVGSITLGLGVGPFPRLSIVGVGIATAIANVFTAVAIIAAFYSSRTAPSLRRPQNSTITRQLVAVSAPMFGEGLAGTLVFFPFNALLLIFGTEVNAAYQIGQRLRKQFTGPIYRAYGTGASILVGQSLGRGDAETARFDGWAVVGLSSLTLAVVAGLLYLGAGAIVGAFTTDPVTTGYAVGFTRVYAVSSVFLGLYFTIRGALQGAGETRVPFLGRLTGAVLLLLGFSYLASVTFGYGVPGIYAGIILSSAWMLGVVALGFARGGWAGRAATMLAARESRAADVE